ncbi:peptidase T [Candidatus Vecturithrix granuli]|uniref:Peptidase T n=1 Tax=Vecturithrix granuli TaxID=1499967 RepID=A0A081C4E6_VECG1|nr:peptidase T [Candidatus Vecturithrix granuli]
MIINSIIQEFLRNEARERFLRYVQIETTSDENSGTHPSSETQWNLARMVKEELEALRLQDVVLDEYCYVYGTLPTSEGVTAPPITFCAHLDTSSSESGKQVKPVLHERYDGGIITFPDNSDLQLSPENSPELKKYLRQTIITASGTTLLGADDKAGIAEIMATLAALQQFKDFSHPELRIVFTPDEEIGEGTLHIKKEKLGRYGYTLDGGDMGELEDECFDALRATLTFHGVNVHPGTAKNRMINAAAIAARFVAMLPEYETPEHTEIREGFYHLTRINGEENLAEIRFILRDFEPAANLKRAELLQHLIQVFEFKYPGLRIELHLKEQYKNMREVLQKYPEVTSKAEQAIEMAGVELIKKAIRGGTDGSRFSFQGMPTPNIFTGGLLAHSKKEWIPEIALQKAAEVILYVCELWTKNE